MKVIEIQTKLNSLFPESTALDWDNVGLQIGSLNDSVEHILLSLDVTLTTVNEAIKHNVDMIISHHPLIFHPIKQINYDQYYGKIIKKLIQHNIVLYILHTNFDVSEIGMNSILADELQLENQRKLVSTSDEIAVGVVGNISKEMKVGQYIELVKERFDIPTLQLIGDADKTVSKVAISGGSGSIEIMNSIAAGVDVLITGDVTYHRALDSIAHDFVVLDVGHNVEKLAFPRLREILIQSGVSTEITISSVDTSPFQTK